MKTINIKLASFTFAAMLMASCSDTNDAPISPTPTNPDVIGKEVTSITDAQELATRVNNFKRAATTRVAGATSVNLQDVYDMPPMPTEAELAAAIEVNSARLPWDADKSKAYIIKKDAEITSAINLSGATLYIAGKLHANDAWGNGVWDNNINATRCAKIILLPDAELTLDYLNSSSQYLFNSSSVKLYNYGGKLKFDEGMTTVGLGNEEGYYTNSDWDLGNRKLIVGNRAQLYVGGKLIAGDLEPQKDCLINIQGGTQGLENKTLTIDGIVNINGDASLKGLTFGNSGILYCCSAIIDGDLTLQGGDGAGSALHTSHLKAKNLYLLSSTNIYMVNNSSIEIEGTLQCNKNGSAMIFLEGENAKAYIKAKTIKYNGSGSPSSLKDCYIFNAQDNGGEFWIDVDNIDDGVDNNLAFSDVNFLGAGKAHNYRLSDSKIKLEPAECGYNIVPEDPGKHIDEVGTITYDHKHDISATCIQPYNGKLYMSYHTRGTGHGGCIEVFETDNQNQTKLLQYLQDTDNTLDFNHLMIDSKSAKPNLYVVGNYGYKNDKGKQSDAGAMMARIDLTSDGLLNTEVKEMGDAAINPLIIVPLENNQSNDEDENAIVRDGDKLLVASTRGYDVYDPNTLESLGSKRTPGKAKHIALNNGEIATLYYNSRDLASSESPVTGTLELFKAGADITKATPDKQIAISEIAPNNGKNTIAIDGNNIYVCRSANGLTCYDKQTGAEKWTWQAPLTATTNKPQGYANGVTFDSQYVYLACGGYGLVILDKNKMKDGKPEIVAKTRVTGVTNDKGKITWNSANYVTLDKGLIYVAYGKNRLVIYQLVDGSMSGSKGDTSKTEEVKK